MAQNDIYDYNDAGEMGVRVIQATAGTQSINNSQSCYTYDADGNLAVRVIVISGGGGGGTVASVNGVQPVDGNVEITGDNINATVGEEEATITQHLTALKNDDAELSEQVQDLQQSINGKQDALTTAQLAAVNSGITSAKVANYDAYANEISTAQSTANKADGAAEVAQQTANLAGQEAAQALSALTGKVNIAQGVDNAGKVMTVGEDGNLAPANVPAGGLPDQTGNSGALLTTDGTDASWTDYSIKVGGLAGQIVFCPKGANIVNNYTGQIYLSGNPNTAQSGMKNSAGAIGIGYNVNVKDSGGCVVLASSIFISQYPQYYTIENKPNQFIWINPNGIFPLFDQNGFLFKERLPQTNYGLKISDTFTQAVNTATTYNLFTTVDLTSDITLAANMDASNYSLVDGALKLPTNAGYVDYGIEVRLNGSFAGEENTNREFGIQLQRADGTIISEKTIVKVSGNDLSNRSVVFETYTNTDADPFIANGLKLVINNTSGQTLNLTGCDILIKARA